MHGKTVLITGAARGIGAEAARQLAKKGARVALLGLEPDALEQVAAECGPDAVWFEVDVTDRDALDRAVSAAVESLGGLDVVVANAGIVTDTGPFWELSLQGWNDVIATNLTGVFHTAKAATPAIIEGGRGGALVLVSSAGAAKGFPNIANYVAAKRGVAGMIRPMAAELGPFSIRVNALAPTNVGTPMFLSETNKKLFVPHLAAPTDEEYEAACRPQHVLPIGWIDTSDTSAAARWLASDEARYVTGIELRVDAGVVVR